MKDFFAPRISADTAPFWEGCRTHKLMLQKCCQCGHLRWPASYLCPECLSEEKELCQMSGEGVVYSYTVMKRAFHPSIKEKTPYIVAEIDLEEGVRILSNIAEGDGVPHCGDHVSVEWVDSETYSRPVFRLKK